MTQTTTYPVICPPQSPPVLSMKKGDTFVDVTVIDVARPGKYNLDQCWDCSRGFHIENTAVIVTFDGDADVTDPASIFGLHEWCAEEYRQRHVPMVVTVHPDGTASVIGPGGNTVSLTAVTVVIEGSET